MLGQQTEKKIQILHTFWKDYNQNKETSLEIAIEFERLFINLQNFENTAFDKSNHADYTRANHLWMYGDP